MNGEGSTLTAQKNEPDWSEAAAEIRRAIFELPGFRSCTVRLAAADQAGHNRAVLRPLKLADELRYQWTLSGGRAADTSNHGRRRARAMLLEMLPAAAAVHVQTDQVDLHARVTKRGRVLFSRSKPLQRPALSLEHDRAKDYPLTRFDSSALLRALGFADVRDKLLLSMRAKYRQVNEFLRELDAALGKSPPPTLRLLDAGCGKAYLSFAALVYLREVRGLDVRLTGVELREDIVASARATAERLELEPGLAEFVAADIASYEPTGRPDVVLSLHACDQASDEALARGVRWEAGTILCAPCCQHTLQRDLVIEGPQRALLRHGILRERLADLLTDAFRAQILRLLGYRVQVIEFVEPEATARNIMIRAQRGVRPGMTTVVEEYLALREAWGVTPWLETRLKSELADFLNLEEQDGEQDERL